MSAQVTETMYEWNFEDGYFARTYCGEYGLHTEWFKGDNFINDYDIPETIQKAHDKKCEDEGLWASNLFHGANWQS